jgi:anti-sigma regulatory factor (Ser/Thr protein kinase)
LEFILTGRPGERREFVEVLEAFCRTHSVPDPVRHAADLALEEYLTNAFHHGLEPGRAPFVCVKLGVEGDCLCVEVVDTGKPFNPLTAPRVDTSLPLEQKPMGGLGLHLIRDSMDDFFYERKDGRNVFRMEKHFPSEAA